MRKFTPPPVPESMWQNPLYFIAFGFGSGAMPIAPGTAGTLMAIPFFLLLSSFGIQNYLILLAVITIASIWLCNRISKEIKVDDHQGMCLDEIVGFLFAMIAVPATFGHIIAAFLLFRIFDIWKPWPIRWIDNTIHGGVGMILDDILAGIYTMLILHAFIWITGK